MFFQFKATSNPPTNQHQIDLFSSSNRKHFLASSTHLSRAHHQHRIVASFSYVSFWDGLSANRKVFAFQVGRFMKLSAGLYRIRCCCSVLSTVEFIQCGAYEHSLFRSSLDQHINKRHRITSHPTAAAAAVKKERPAAKRDQEQNSCSRK